MTIRPTVALISALVLSAPPAQSQATRPLGPRDRLDSTIAPGARHDFSLRLARGESVDLTVLQRGVDLVLELFAPDNTPLGVFDSPNGRSGDEPLEIIAGQSGRYSLRIRPFDANEPAGSYTLTVASWRDVRATRALLQGRQAAREAASAWLQGRSTPIPASAVFEPGHPLSHFDSLAARVRVMGIGEATHGSAEFSALRLSLTKRLIGRHGYRLVAIEASAARLRLLNDFITGASGLNTSGPDDFQWIGAQSRRDLVSWLRAWNVANPTQMVRLVGVDPQDNAFDRDSLQAFLARAYGAEAVRGLGAMFAEFAAADEQVVVFGNSGVDSTARQSILALVAMLELDAPMHSARFGSESVARARAVARELAQMADFNGGGAPASHSRDYYMAANVLTAMQDAGPDTRVVLWAHNAHVAHPEGQSERGRTTGAWLRQALGCDYAALGVTFGEGAFLAQIPNDPTNRLAVSSLPLADEATIDGVLRRVNRDGVIASWGCEALQPAPPPWLQEAQRMHWVGALYAPGSPPGEAFAAFRLLRDFDAIAYIGRVTADQPPAARPVVPARVRR